MLRCKSFRQYLLFAHCGRISLLHLFAINNGLQWSLKVPDAHTFYGLTFAKIHIVFLLGWMCLLFALLLFFGGGGGWSIFMFLFINGENGFLMANTCSFPPDLQ